MASEKMSFAKVSILNDTRILLAYERLIPNTEDANRVVCLNTSHANTIDRMHAHREL